MSKSSNQVESLESLLEKSSLSPADLDEAKRILYGKAIPSIPISAYAVSLSEKNNFEIRAFQKDAAQEQVSRNSKIGDFMLKRPESQ
jgi:hypothetical protein